MLKTSVGFWLTSIQILSLMFDSSNGNSTEGWFQQPRDHFDSSNDRKWYMKYYENIEFFDNKGPIFILIGGESAICPDNINEGFVFKLAEAHRAMMYSTEHRYYGQSRISSNTASTNLKYLEINQVLADLAAFIEAKREDLNMPQAQVIVFGDSYSGNLAAWMRVTYPELVTGALADSAPVHAKVDYFEFFEAVADSLRNYDANCVKKIEEAFSTLEKFVRESKSNQLKRDFNLCSKPTLSDPTDVSYMMLKIADIFGAAVVDNTPNRFGKRSIPEICDFMTRTGTNDTSYIRLTKAFKRFTLRTGVCFHLKYQKWVNNLLDTAWGGRFTDERLWLYQTCTELGYYQTSSSPKSIFGSLFPLEFYKKQCRDVFGQYYCEENVHFSMEEITLQYNSKLSDTTNIIFTNGNLDPWHRLSVLSDLNADSPSILMDGVSHGDFLLADESTDPASLKEARYKVAMIITTWLDPSHL